jgi:hypothetical protein
MSYALIICGPCSKDQHEDCGGRKATLTINGEPFTGVCQCTKHSSIKPKQKQENDHEAAS